MRNKILALLLIAAFAPGIALARPKERVFNASPERIFAAAVAAARENFALTHIDERAMTFGFHTGISYTSNGFDCDVSVVPTGEGSKVIVRVQKIRQLFAWGRRSDRR